MMKVSMAQRITDEEKEKIRELIQKGLSGKEISKKLNLNKNTASIYVSAFNKGFNSLIDYQNHLAKNRQYNSFQDYKESWAKKKGFSSHAEYNKYLAKQRQKKPEYQGLSNLIKEKLGELGRNQSWLAIELGISRQAVSQYVHGEIFPKEDVRERLDRILLMSKGDLEARV